MRYIMEEIWKDIKGYEELYQVSNLGNIKSKDKIIDTTKNKINKKGILLKQYKDKGGYMRVCLTKNNIRKMYFVHRIVALNFIKNNGKLPFINHKDENKQNNCVTNLEWCNRKYNNNYGTRSTRAGLKCRKKINQYDLDGNFIKTYDSVMKAKKENSSSCGTHISEVCKGKRKSAYGYIWRYAY